MELKNLKSWNDFKSSSKPGVKEEEKESTGVKKVEDIEEDESEESKDSKEEPKKEEEPKEDEMKPKVYAFIKSLGDSKFDGEYFEAVKALKIYLKNFSLADAQEIKKMDNEK